MKNCLLYRYCTYYQDRPQHFTNDAEQQQISDFDQVAGNEPITGAKKIKKGSTTLPLKYYRPISESDCRIPNNSFTRLLIPSKSVYRIGTIYSVNKVAHNKPPITTTAIGA